MPTHQFGSATCMDTELYIQWVMSENFRQVAAVGNIQPWMRVRGGEKQCLECCQQHEGPPRWEDG